MQTDFQPQRGGGGPWSRGDGGQECEVENTGIVKMVDRWTVGLQSQKEDSSGQEDGGRGGGRVEMLCERGRTESSERKALRGGRSARESGGREGGVSMGC
eukprot:515285-Rhodomonas_salina.1